MIVIIEWKRGVGNVARKVNSARFGPHLRVGRIVTPEAGDSVLINTNAPQEFRRARQFLATLGLRIGKQQAGVTWGIEAQ